MKKIDLKKLVATLFIIFSTFISHAQTPNIPDAPTAMPNCGEIILTRGTPPAGVTWYWQQYDFYKNTSNSAETFVPPSYTNEYYLKARNNSSGQWSDAVVVDYSDLSTYTSGVYGPYSSDVSKSNNSDGSVTLTRDDPPSGETYYWQTTSEGKSLTNTQKSFTVYTGSIYYLRARDNSTGCWGNSRSITFSASGVIPPNIPTATPNCGEVLLTRGDPPTGVIWYWQYFDSSKNTDNSAKTFSPPSYTDNYFIKAYDINSNKWSEAVEIDYSSISTSTSYPSRPYSSDVDKSTNSDGSVTLTRDNHPNGETYYWQSTNDGTSLTNSNQSITLTSGNEYYLRTRDNETGCWSNALSISYTVSIVNPPTVPIISYDCSSGDVTFTRGNPPSDETWYWQSSATGTSRTYSSVTKTITYGEGTYYLRSRQNSSPYNWSEAVGVNYSTHESKPNTPYTYDVSKSTNADGSVTLSRDNPPNGETWYWQSTSNGTSLADSNVTIKLTSGTIYYLRARNNSTGCWSDGSASIAYSVLYASVPDLPVLNYECNGSSFSVPVLTRGTPPTGTTWYWQSSATGTSKSNSDQTYRAPYYISTYYLRANVNSTNYWSDAVSVSFVSNQTAPYPPSYINKVTNSDGSVTLSKYGAAPSDVTWYWQATSEGTSLADSNDTIKLTSGSIYYLRARNNNSGCWSDGSASMTYSTSYAQTPEIPIVSYDCNVPSYYNIKPILTRETPPEGTTWYWQSSATGTSTYNNSGVTYTPTSGSIYYLRAKKNGTNYWSDAISVNYVSNQRPPSTPSSYSLSKTTNSDGSITLSRPNPPSGETYYWQKTSDGEDLSNSQKSFIVTSGSIYYLRSRNDITGCWSNAVSISYTVNYVAPPDIPTLTYDCNVSSYSYVKPILTRSTPPTGVTWYWQSSPTGTSTYNNSGVTYTPSSGTIYYLRGRTNSGYPYYWSEAVSVNYVSNKRPPSAPSSYSLNKTNNSDGSVTLSRPNPPSGETYYWQKTSDDEDLSNSQKSFIVTSGNIYYLRSRNNNTGCWSGSVSISYTANFVAKPDVPTLTYNCDVPSYSRIEPILTRGTPPSGVTWYWQSSPTGTSTYNNSGVTYSPNSGSVYYLRGRTSIGYSHYWGEAVSISYVSNQSPPSAPLSYSLNKTNNSDGSVTLSRPNPPSGETYYWQTNSDGTSLENSQASFTVYTGNISYLRSHNNITDCWSTAVSISYTTYSPSTPEMPIITQNCGSVILKRVNPPSDETWYWQSSPTGTSKLNSEESLTRSIGDAYYLRANATNTSYWGEAIEIRYNISSVTPIAPSIPTVVNNFGNTVITRPDPPTGETYYWQDTSNGTSKSNSDKSMDLETGNVIYLRAYNDDSGCWSDEVEVNYIVISETLPAEPSLSYSCGDNTNIAVLTRSTPPEGITWYWQSENDGTDTLNSDETITLESGDVYYLRARNNNTLGWSYSVSKSYTINTLPGIPDEPVITYIEDSVTLAKGESPSGINWYWQESADGISDLNNDSSISFADGSAFYLRGKDNITGCWGPARKVHYVLKPKPVTITNNCDGTTILTREAPPENVTWYWQTSSYGTNKGSWSTNNALESVTMETGTRHYLKAYNSILNQWSEARVIDYEVYQKPSIPTQPTITMEDGRTILTKGASTENNVNWYWQSNPEDFNNDVAAFEPSISLVDGTIYYLKAYNTATECWGDALTVNYTVRPNTPTINNIITDCGVTTLFRNEPPQGITWYWQHQINGYEKTNSDLSIDLSDGAEYYLRANNDATNEWSNITSIPYSVRKIPNIPNLPNITYNDGNTTLSFNGSPENNVIWYWQNNINGFNTTNAANSVTLYENNQYFLRAYNTISQCWSDPRVIDYTIETNPLVPTIDSVVQDCGSTKIIRNEPTNANEIWCWQNEATGTSQIYSHVKTMTKSSGNTYFLRAFNTKLNHWSDALEINYEVASIPKMPYLKSLTHNSGQVTISRDTAPEGHEYYWQSKYNGESTENSAMTIIVPEGPVVYLRSYNIASGCWSLMRRINTHQSDTPDTPTLDEVTITNNCGSTILNKGYTAPSGILYYWNSSPTGLQNTGTYSTTIELSSGNVYYLRARNVVTNNSSEPLVVEYTIDNGPEKPLQPTITQELGSTILGKNGVMPTGVQWYWQSLPDNEDTSAAALADEITLTSENKYYLRGKNDNGCWGEALEINYSILLPDPPVVTNVNYHQFDEANSLEAIGTNLKWYTLASGGTQYASIPIPSTFSIGKKSYFVSQTVNGVESLRAELVVEIHYRNTTLPPTVETNVEYTEGDTTEDFVVEGTDLKWYSTATGGTGTTLMPTPNTAIAGVTSYYVSQTIDGLESSRAEIIVTIYPQSPIVTNTVNYNLGSTATPLTAVGTNLLWYTSATSGTGVVNAPIPETSVAGNTSYYVSQTVNNVESSRTEILVTVVTVVAPEPPIVVDISYNVGDVATVLSAEGTDLKWYTSETGGVGETNAPLPATSAAGITSYFVSQTVNNVESLRAEIVVTINDLGITPPPNVVDVSYNVGDLATELSAVGTNLKWYLTLTGGVGETNAPFPNTNIAGITSYYVSQTIDSIESSRAKIVVTISELTMELKTWYADTDNDGFGDPNSSISSATKPVGYVTNNYDGCPQVYSEAGGCPEENINWTQATAFDITGKIISISKSYFDDLGKGIQSQSIDIKTGRTWASQTLYDSQGRPALSSLSAPVFESGGFTFNSSFIKNDSGNTYTVSDYEGVVNGVNKVYEPTPIGTQMGTLGRYYSNLNTDEYFKGNNYQDVTAFPFSRTVYSELNPGAALKSIGGNKVDVNNNGTKEWANGFAYSMPAGQEIYYVFGKDKFQNNSEIEQLEQLLNLKRSYSDQSLSTATHYGYRYASSSACLDSIVGDESHYGENIRADFPLEIGKIYKIEELGFRERYIQIINTFPYGTTQETTDPDFILREGSWDSCEEFDDQLNKESLVESILTNQTNINWLKVNKNITQDIDGNESVVFIDTDGNTLATARSGGSQQYEVISLIGKQEFIDIHIPVGCENTVIFLGADGTDFDIYNLKTEVKLANDENMSAGFYRIQYIGSNKTYLEYPALSYITETNTLDKVFTESIGVKYKVNYYDYSLYYYDKANRLVKSTQPLGFDDTSLNGFKTKIDISHSLYSDYEYNSLGQLVYTKNPDEGTAWFKYRNDGQIRYSQNSKQLAAIPQEFSYTNYDNLGRPIESGVLTSTFDTNLDPNGTLPTGTKAEIQQTTYDQLEEADSIILSALDVSYHIPSFLAGNVAKTYNDETTTYYSYDIYGRVKWIVQNINGLGTKTIDYQYDPVTSAVTKVDFQRYTTEERFIHQYTYNNVNELIKVETSTDDITYTTQADYNYYETGALRRVELAEGLQGTDYVYNLNGQLKSINHPSLDSIKDPGGDANDLFGLAIDYHKNDYNRTQRANINSTTIGTDQFNGNIKATRWNNDYNKLENAQNAYSYQYNTNNWLTGANYGAYANGTFNADVNHSYEVSGIEYDANGNISKLKRNKDKATGNVEMDNFTYNYKTGKPNQLDFVSDAVIEETGVDDLKNQPNSNYFYNEIGQLIEDYEYVDRNDPNDVDDIVRYVYNTSGLVTEVSRKNVPLVKFFYNDKGQRVRKEAYSDIDGTLIKTEYYVRDAAGSVLAIYNGNQQKEIPIYGTSRLGIYNKASDNSVYQLTDHLGNVRATVMRDINSNAEIASATDYYPFGMPMPGKQIVGGELYRYAFQGQEKDPETGKEAFQLRLWDGRIGRWLTTDPMGEFHSPYLGMGNNPIVLTDPDGGSTDNEYLIRRDGSKEQIGTKGGDLVDYYTFEFGHQDYGRMFVVNKLFDFSAWTNQFTPVDDYIGFIDDFKSDIFEKSIGQSIDNYRFSSKSELLNSASNQIDKILFNHGVLGNGVNSSSIDRSKVMGLAFDLGQPVINKAIDNRVNHRILKFMFKGATETIGLYLSSQSLGGPTPQQYRQGNIPLVKNEINNYFNKNIDFSTYFNIYIGRKF